MQVDEQYLAKVEAIIAQLPTMLAEIGQTIPVEITALIQSHFNVGAATRDPSNATWSTSDQLNHFKTLANSFMSGAPGSLTEIKADENGLTANIGSAIPYAQIQEEGGFVQSKGSMHKYFWAMFYKTNNSFFKVMALSAKTLGGVNIPARPYFAPALKEYEDSHSLDAFNDLIDKIAGLM